ncbi:MAG: hypothetical protein ACK4S4_10155 [Pyrinomonadaceae bacterium]
MRYTPNFCCNCGEKIERIHWPIWSAKRFCELCETDYWIFDAAPKLAVSVIAFLGLLGIASYLRTPPSGSPPANAHAVSARLADRPDPRPAAAAPQSDPPAAAAVTVPPAAAMPQDKAVYYCGATTKKNTPCTRRVKNRGDRCWQHVGRPAAENPRTPAR